jgi:putative peptidoglycan lipid II flippase
VLNSHERFLLSASTPMFYNLTIAGVAWAVVPRVGNPATVLACAVLVGGALQFAVQAPAVRRLGFRLRPLWRELWNPRVRQVLILMLPGIPVLGINQLNQLITNRFASFLGEGGVTYVYYSYRVTELMFGLVVVQLTTVLLPLLSRELNAAPDSAPTTLLKTIRLVTFVTLPAATVMTLLSAPIIGLLFGGGRFSAADVVVTGATLTAYAFSLVGTGHVKIMASAFFAHKDTRTPMWGSFVALIVFTTTCWIVVGRLGAPGLGWSNTVAMACYSLFLTVLYARRHGFGGASFSPTLVAVARQVVACIVVAAGLQMTRGWLADIDHTSLDAAIRLGSVLLAAGAAYVALVTVMGGREMRNLLATLKREDSP